MNTTTLARNSDSTKPAAKSGRSSGPKVSESDVDQASAKTDPDATKKQKATKLMEQARAALESGDLSTAQAKAEEANRLNVAYKLFDDLPEVVLNEVAARRAAENIASTADTSVCQNYNPSMCLVILNCRISK